MYFVPSLYFWYLQPKWEFNSAHSKLQWYLALEDRKGSEIFVRGQSSWNTVFSTWLLEGKRQESYGSAGEARGFAGRSKPTAVTLTLVLPVGPWRKHKLSSRLFFFFQFFFNDDCCLFFLQNESWDCTKKPVSESKFICVLWVETCKVYFYTYFSAHYRYLSNNIPQDSDRSTNRAKILWF